MRFLASILFALMTLILPTAGVARNFCTMMMAFVSEEVKCPADGGDCCCEEGKHTTSQPDCMIAAKPLPNADKNPVPHFPGADGGWVLLAPSGADFPASTASLFPAALVERGPPVIPDPLYLTQRRLLI